MRKLRVRRGNLQPSVIGILLAGGESRRFGTPKVFALYQGKYFYEQAVSALLPSVDSLVIVSHPTLTQRFPQDLRFPIIEDHEMVQGKGPLAGMYTVMKQFRASWYFVLACDMPLMDPLTVDKIVSAKERSYQAVVPVISEKIQPLTALYHASTLPVLEKQLQTGNYRMMDFIEKLNIKTIIEGEITSERNPFQNINTLEAYYSLLPDKTR